MKTTTRWGALLTAGALSLSLAACGGDDEAGSSGPATTSVDTPTAPADGVATATTPADGAGATSAEPADQAAEGEEIPIQEFLAMLKSPGEEKLSSYDMEMRMDVGGQVMEGVGAVDISGDQAAMDLTMTVPGAGEVHLVMADGRVFMQAPGMTEEGKFMEVPSEALGDMSAIEDIDITSQWDAWEQGAKKVEFLGEEDVDGQDMRHYAVTVDTEAAMDAAGQTGGDAAAASSMMGEEFVYDVWLDDDNLMRKLTFDMDDPAAGGSVAMEMLADNWGEAKAIEVPAEGDLQQGDMGGATG